ncbi:MAG TPA: hypothetical protein VNA04_07320, partial [Thermoanaerobaculia bacterium]|nr:hypothetical protein [Thermoanaerobaculia bacterium]
MALALVLAVFSPVAALIANAYSAMPCCAAADDSVSAPRPCCQPAMCANPSPARQPKAIDTSAQPGPAAEPATRAAGEIPL